jgi:hypothetical protein
MKGLKSLTAVVVGIALLASAAPASAQGAAFKHYIACGLSQSAKPAHLCQKARKKGAFFRSNKADVFYTVCVNFPTKKNQQDHLQHPRQASGELVRGGQKGRLRRLHGSGVAGR